MRCRPAGCILRDDEIESVQLAGHRDASAPKLSHPRDLEPRDVVGRSAMLLPAPRERDSPSVSVCGADRVPLPGLEPARRPVTCPALNVPTACPP